MTFFFPICKILKCDVSTILKLPLERLLKCKFFLLLSFNFNNWTYIGIGRTERFFQKHDKFSNLISKSTASLHPCRCRRNVCQGIFSETGENVTVTQSMVNTGVLPQASTVLLDNVLCFISSSFEWNRSTLQTVL